MSNARDVKDKSLFLATWKHDMSVRFWTTHFGNRMRELI